MANILPSTKILGISITTASKKKILEYIFKRLEDKREKFYIVTPNPEILMHASRSKPYQDILNKAEVSIPDGIGVLIAGNILKKGLHARITGVDLMLELCRESVKRSLNIGLLGGGEGVAEKTAECLREKYPSLRVIYSSGSDGLPRILEGPMDSDAQTTVYNLPKQIGHIDILFVAMGAPKQEEWIAKNLPDIDVTLAMGVGGAFNYISGKVPRAPKLVRSAGLEWAFRLARQPWRAKRQLVLPAFALKVFQERFWGPVVAPPPSDNPRSQ